MRVALIDHHDSFAANLAHLIGATLGHAPDILRHDAPGAVEAAGAYDALVLSPGPGRADRPGDLGATAALLKAYRGPVLGVCLGHQALCLEAGGRIARAAEPMHGRTSAVRHDGRGLFAGVPAPLTVVRYHSWVVTDAGEAAEARAWTEDGAIMAADQPQRRRWGVQFHPESVAAEAGGRLIANFLDLARAGRRPPRIAARQTSRPRAASAAPPRADAPGETPARLTLVHRRLGIWRAPEAVCAQLYGDRAPAFWLDSAAAGAEPGGRWSFMGDAAGPNAERWRYDAAARALRVDGAGRPAAVRPGPFFAALEAALATRVPPSGAPRALGPDAPPFCGGFVGALGYGLAGEGEDAPPTPLRTEAPDAELLFADRVLAFDHAKRVVWALVLERPERAPRAQAWLDAAEADLRAVAAAPRPQVLPSLSFRPRQSRAAYADAIGAAQRAIRAGESYEVCLTTEFAAPRPPGLDALAAYRAVRRANLAPYAAFLNFGGGRALLCASPERFLRITADGMMEAKPIKGTAPRSRDPAEDDARAAALAADAKTRAENLMIVDVLRNDLGRSAALGSVTTPHLFAVERHAHVHQLVSTVRARLRPGVSPVAAVRAAFPGGSMTGAPKPRTLALIDALEARARGAYSGAIGYFSVTGAVDLNIVIRTAAMDAERIRVGAGGAILSLSDVESECEEVWWKAQGLLSALGGADDAGAAWRGLGDVRTSRRRKVMG